MRPGQQPGICSNVRRHRQASDPIAAEEDIRLEGEHRQLAGSHLSLVLPRALKQATESVVLSQQRFARPEVQERRLAGYRGVMVYPTTHTHHAKKALFLPTSSRNRIGNALCTCGAEAMEI